MKIINTTILTLFTLFLIGVIIPTISYATNSSTPEKIEINDISNISQKESIPMECTNHIYQNGKCSTCGKECPHELHDQNGICDVCGIKTAHSFDMKTDECEICKKHLTIIDEMPDENLLKECSNKGKVIEDAVPYDGRKQRIQIYLPCGYDNQKQYNCIILMHGMHSNGREWLDSTHKMGAHEWKMTDMFDNMIEQGISEPFIAVSLDHQSWRINGDLTKKIGVIIRDTVMPYVADYYATYAKDGSEKCLKIARDHFIIGGLSQGGYFTTAAYEDCIDLCSNFMMLSGIMHQKYLLNPIEEGMKDKELNFCYINAGKTDPARRNSEYVYGQLLKNPYFKENKNICFRIEGQAHTWDVWTIGVFNTIQKAWANL